jgi:hypothetical protein
MKGHDTRHIRGEDLIPITWDQAKRIMKPKADDDEYYIAAIYVLSPAALVFAAVQRRHKPEDLAAVCTIWRGQPFIIAAIRKQNLPPAEYAQLVRKHLGRDIAVEEGCVDIWTPAFAVRAGEEMVADLFGARRELAMRA